MSITATTSLASRIDHCEMSMTVGMAGTSRSFGVEDVQVWPVAGGAAVLAGPGSPFNKVIAAGFGDPGEAADWSLIEREHGARQAKVQVECSTLADPRMATMLTERGYRLVGFENVLARRLSDDGNQAGSGDVSVSVVEDEEKRLWMETLTTGFLHPDSFDGPVSHESFDRSALEHAYELFGALPGVVRLIARRQSEVAGGGSLYLHDGVALLCGAATLPAHRRRGVQATLLQARLTHARAMGCDLAVVTTQPGSKSQENVQRMGFELIYSRAILVKEAAAENPRT